HRPDDGRRRLLPAPRWRVFAHSCEKNQQPARADVGLAGAPRYNCGIPAWSVAMSTTASQISVPATETSPLRFVTAASLFDGHDAAINIMRRLIQAQGAEVIHLGHNRSVEDVVRAALQEDADAIALSSYQGGHVEYFKYMVDMLRERGAGHIRVVGGGGGTITPEEIRELEAYGVERIYHPNDGMKLGLVEMIEDVVERVSRARDARAAEARQPAGTRPSLDDEIAIGRVLSAIEDGAYSDSELAMLRKQWAAGAAGHAGPTPVIGITGTGGAGKSSVTDELLNRFLASFPQMRMAVVSVDPTRRPPRGRAAGRPHPHELAAQPPRVHALHGHPAPERGHERGAEGLHRLPEGAGLRPGDRGDRRHRPERLRDRRPGRLPHVRHDQRLRRGQPAREDRHDRLRRADRAQQVRRARRRGRRARRAQAVEAQPRGLQAGRRGRAGRPDRRQAVERPRDQLDVRQPVPPAAREGAGPGRGRRRRP